MGLGFQIKKSGIQIPAGEKILTNLLGNRPKNQIQTPKSKLPKVKTPKPKKPKSKTPNAKIPKVITPKPFVRIKNTEKPKYRTPKY